MALAKKPITFKNAVNPLTWNVPIVNKDGSPTTEFQQKWLQQATTNASIVNLTTAAGVSAVLDLITALAGSLLVRGTTRWQGLPSPADATMFLNGAAAPAFAKVKDTDLAVTDVVGNNVSIAAHGFAPKAPNDATKYLDGTGAYSTPPSGGTAAASIYDDGTNIYLALVDADEQLVLDGSGLGVYAPEVFPVASIPALPYDASGAAAAAIVTAQAYVDGKIGGAAWVPADASGAGITFSGVSCAYVHAGGIYFCTFDMTVSANASGAVFDCGGLPATVGTRVLMQVVVVGVASIGVVSVSPGSATFGLNDATNAQYTNAALSGKRVIGTAAFTV